MTRSATIAIVALALAAPAAQAADGTLYGGGKPGTASRPDQHVALDRTGGKATFYMSLSADCGAPVTFATQVNLNRSGEFSKSGQYKEELGDNKGTYTASGRIVGGRARGNVRVRFEATGSNGRVSCDTGRIKWRASAPTSSDVTGKLKPGARYYGYTSQRSIVADLNLPLLLETTGDGNRVKRMSARLNNFCEDESFGAQASGTFFLGSFRIDKGDFVGTDRFTEDHGDTTWEFEQIVRGHFRRARVSGTWKVTVVIRRKTDRSVVTRCGGDKLRWQAAR